MAETSKPAAGKDVAEPGSTPPDATSKPVIVGHSAQIADPMVSAATTGDPSQDEKPAPPVAPAVPTGTGSSKPKLMPSSTAQDAQAAADKEENAEVEADTAEAKEEEQHQARLQELIESGEYNVSIGQKANKNSARTFILTVLAILLVGIITLYILTDLKVVDFGVKVPFHIFGKEEVKKDTTKPATTAPAAVTVKKTLPITLNGYTLSYDPDTTKAQTQTLAGATAYYYVTFSDKDSTSVLIEQGPKGKAPSCATDSSCLNLYSNYTAQRIPGVTKTKLYFYTRVVKIGEGLYSAEYGVSPYVKQDVMPKNEKVVLFASSKPDEFINISGSLFDDGKYFKTAEDAKAAFSGTTYQKVKSLILTLTDK